MLVIEIMEVQKRIFIEFWYKFKVIFFLDRFCMDIKILILNELLNQITVLLDFWKLHSWDEVIKQESLTERPEAHLFLFLTKALVVTKGEKVEAFGAFAPAIFWSKDGHGPSKHSSLLWPPQETISLSFERQRHKIKSKQRRRHLIIY